MSEPPLDDARSQFDVSSVSLGNDNNDLEPVDIMTPALVQPGPPIDPVATDVSVLILQYGSERERERIEKREEKQKVSLYASAGRSRAHVWSSFPSVVMQ